MKIRCENCGNMFEENILIDDMFCEDCIIEYENIENKNLAKCDKCKSWVNVNDIEIINGQCLCEHCWD